MRAVAGPGRWAWAVSGVVAAAALAIPGTGLITSAGVPWHQPPPQHVTVRSLTVPQPVTSLTVTQPVTSLMVQDYGGQVRVTAGQVRQVQVTETIMYDLRAGVPAATDSVAGGRLNLSDPACQNTDCEVDFAVTVPPGVTVTVDTQGGPADVSGIAGGSVNTDGDPRGSRRSPDRSRSAPAAVRRRCGCPAARTRSPPTAKAAPS